MGASGLADGNSRFIISRNSTTFFACFAQECLLASEPHPARPNQRANFYDLTTVLCYASRLSRPFPLLEKKETVELDAALQRPPLQVPVLSGVHLELAQIAGNALRSDLRPATCFIC